MRQQDTSRLVSQNTKEDEKMYEGNQTTKSCASAEKHFFCPTLICIVHGNGSVQSTCDDTCTRQTLKLCKTIKKSFFHPMHYPSE